LICPASQRRLGGCLYFSHDSIQGWEPGRWDEFRHYLRWSLFAQSSFVLPAGEITKEELRSPSTTGLDVINFNVNLGNVGLYYSGTKFESNSVFYSYADIDSGGNSTIFGWGYLLIPLDKTSIQILVGDGRACTNTTACAQSISPIWVTCEEDCDLKLYLDGINSASYEELFNVTALESIRFYDNNSP